MSCLEGGFRSIAQDSAFFHDSLGYHEWEGVSDDSAEAERLGKNVKDTSICCLIMYNHGFCALGATLGEAWVLAYYFEISCRNQLNLLQTGQPIKYPDPKVLQHSHDQLVCGGIEFRAGQAEWAALRRMVAGREGRDGVNANVKIGAAAYINKSTSNITSNTTINATGATTGAGAETVVTVDQEDEDEVVDEETALRIELADAHHITRKYGMDQMVWNHISARLSDGSYV